MLLLICTIRLVNATRSCISAGCQTAISEVMTQICYLASSFKTQHIVLWNNLPIIKMLSFLISHYLGKLHFTFIHYVHKSQVLKYYSSKIFQFCQRNCILVISLMISLTSTFEHVPQHRETSCCVEATEILNLLLLDGTKVTGS